MLDGCNNNNRETKVAMGRFTSLVVHIKLMDTDNTILIFTDL